MASRFSVEAIFSAVDRITAPVKKMERSVGGFSKKSIRSVNRLHGRMGNFGSGVGKVMRNGAIGVGILGAAFTDIIGVGMRFEQSITNAAAKFPERIAKGSEAFKALTAAARKNGRETEFSASQSAEALNFLAMAGFTAQTAMAALPAVTRLATAGNMDLAEASDIASDALGAFGMMTKDPIELAKNLQFVNDVLAKTSTSANTTIPEMFEAIKESAAIATDSKGSIKTYAAMLGIMAGSGIKASKAGTTLKNMFVRLAAPVPKSQKVIDKLGLSLSDKDGKMRDMIDILSDFNEKTKDMTPIAKKAAISTIFGREALAGVSVLLKAGSKGMNEYRSEMESLHGTNQRISKYIGSTTGKSFTALQSSIESVKLSIYGMNQGGIKETIDQMVNWTRANEALIATKIGGFLKYIVDNLDTIVTTVKNVALAFAGFWAIMALLKAFIVVMTVVNLVMALNPFVAMALGVTALTLILGALIAYFHDDLVAGMVLGIEKMVEGWQWLGDFIGSIGDAITGTIDIMLERIMAVVDAVTTLDFDKIGGTIKTLFGFDGDDSEAKAPAPQVVSPQARTARQIDEHRTTSSSEVTLKADSNTSAEVTKGKLGSQLQLQQSGAF